MSSNTPEGPASGGPEYLESAGGAPVGPSAPESSGSGRKRAIVVGGVVAVLAVGGGAAWALTSFMSTGDQPAQALPAGTLAYASIDLDPSGGQKVEAIQTLREFPAFRDQVGLETDDDIKEKVFQEAVESGECEGLDYAADVEPWLGDRMAVAAVDLGEEQPSPVFVVQVSDADAAQAGVDKLVEVCGGAGATDGESPEGESGEGEGGVAFDGDWMVFAETDDLAQQAVDAEGSLADDADFQKWTGEAGDAGIASFYVAPSAGQVLAELAEAEADDEMSGMGSGDMSQMTEALKDFQGAAGVVRFADGGMEMEFAAGAAGQLAELSGSDQGGESIGSLPADTVAAFGVGLSEGWLGAMMEQVAEASGGMMTPEDLYSEVETQTGLALPEDAETLLGESVAVSVGPGIDPEAIFNSADPTNIPVGVKIKGDAAAIEGVLDKIRPQLAGSGMEDMLATASEGDFVALSPSAEYRDAIAADGGLADSEAYQSVIEQSDGATGVLFVDFDGGDGWLDALASEDPEVAENLKPLSALGFSGWRDGDVSHAVLKITTG